MDDIKLVSLVQESTPLYIDPSNIKNTFLRMKKWAAIAETLGVTPEAAETRFTNLRSSFGRHLNKPEVQTIEDIKWQHKILNWLVPYMTDKDGQLLIKNQCESAGHQQSSSSSTTSNTNKSDKKKVERTAPGRDAGIIIKRQKFKRTVSSSGIECSSCSGCKAKYSDEEQSFADTLAHKLRKILNEAEKTEKQAELLLCFAKNQPFNRCTKIQ